MTKKKKTTTTSTTTTTTTTTITTTKNRQTLDRSSIQGDTNLSVQLQTPRIEEDLFPPGKKLKLTGGSTDPTNLSAAPPPSPMTAAPFRRNNPFTDSSHDMSILLHFDGGSRGNPGVAGSGAHIVISRRVGLRQHDQDDNQVVDDDHDQNDDTNDTRGVRMVTSTRTTTRRTVVVSRSTIRLQRFLQGSQTNNQAEYWGLITGLECVYEQLAQQEPFLKEEKKKNHAKHHPKLPWTVSLTIQGDSKLVVQQMNGAWKVGDILQPAYQTAQECLHRIQALCRDTGVLLHYRLSHVYRNENKDADRTCETTI
jgi:ribonuclease HI